MARTKQTARKDTGGKPLAMGRGRAKGQPEEEPYVQGEERTGRWCWSTPLMKMPHNRRRERSHHRGRGRAKGNPKKNPTPGRADRKVVLEYSSDEDAPQPAEGAEPPSCEEADTPDSANQPSPCDHD